MSANFDNIADVQILSPTLLDGYLKAAAEISRLAVGNPATAIETTYTKSRTYSQWDWVDGAPYGTRGGISVVTTSPPMASTSSRWRSSTPPPAVCRDRRHEASRSRFRSTASVWR